MNDIEQAIETLRTLNFCGLCTTGSDKDGGCNNCDRFKAKKLAIQSLQEKQERDNPQPLTVEELKQMNGEPVYLFAITPDKSILESSQYAIITQQSEEKIKFAGALSEWWFALRLNYYGKSWLAYKYKPKEDE